MLWSSPTTRDIVMQTRQQLDDHVKGCTEQARRTHDSIVALGASLEASAAERRNQFDRLNSWLWKIAAGIVTGLFVVLYDVLKAKGIF